MHRHRLHSELDHYRLPEPPAPAVTGNSFIVCPAVLFAGSQDWQPWQCYLYQVALAQGYRFLSFGDAMIVGKKGAMA